MNIYEANHVLPFDVYQNFLGRIEKTNKRLYDFLDETGMAIKSEKEYEIIASKVKRSNDFSKEGWEKVAKNFRCYHISNIDRHCSELKFLSDAVAKEGIAVFGGTAKVKMSQVNMAIENVHVGRVPIEITYQAELDVPVIGRIPLFRIFDVTFKENSNKIILTKVLRR